MFLTSAMILDMEGPRAAVTLYESCRVGGSGSVSRKGRPWSRIHSSTGLSGGSSNAC